MTAAELAEAIGRYQAALAPAPRQAVAMLLTRLALHFWEPNRPQAHMDALIEDYGDDLARFPLDLVAWAIADYRRHGGKFFPKVAELISRIEPKHRTRVQALADLREILAQRSAPAPARTDADRAAGLEAFAEMRQALDGPAPIGDVAAAVRRRAGG